MDDSVRKVWDYLGRVKSLTFTAISAAKETTGWTGQASGAVEVERLSPACFLFREAGAWQTPGGKSFAFSNCYRWSLFDDRIQLEHLRFGTDRPVHLFHLIPSGESRMVSQTAHVCSEDLYTATLELSAGMILLDWSVTGPAKQERIEYRYSLESAAGD